jgi:hypothetical protein
MWTKKLGIMLILAVISLGNVTATAQGVRNQNAEPRHGGAKSQA